MSNLPPAYDEPQENVPSYASTSDISARWHLINTPAKGLYGSRGLSLVSDLSAITIPGTTPSMGGYDLIFVDSLTIEVHPKAPLTGPKSSDEPWKTPVIAKINFSPTDPAKASISFTSRDNAKIVIVDSEHLRKGIFSIGDVDPNELRLIKLYHAAGDRLPVAWSVQDNKDITPMKSTPEKSSADNPIPEYDIAQTGKTKSESKWSWKSKLKETIPKEHKRSKSTAAEDSRAQRQREGLSSNFTLLDASGTTYAKFANEFFTDPSNSTKIPTYEKEVKNHKPWGHLDIHDPRLTAIRSSYSDFGKWDESDLELVVLLTLVVILEVNLKIYGGADRNSIFSKTVFAGGFGGVNEGKAGILASGLGVVAGGVQWIVKGLEGN